MLLEWISESSAFELSLSRIESLKSWLKCMKCDMKVYIYSQIVPPDDWWPKNISRISKFESSLWPSKIIMMNFHRRMEGHCNRSQFFDLLMINWKGVGSWLQFHSPPVNIGIGHRTLLSTNQKLNTIDFLSIVKPSTEQCAHISRQREGEWRVGRGGGGKVGIETESDFMNICRYLYQSVCK